MTVKCTLIHIGVKSFCIQHPNMSCVFAKVKYADAYFHTGFSSRIEQIVSIDFASFMNIWQGRIDVVEFIIEQMHRNKVQPDPSTCLYVFSGYVDRGFHSTAMEALQVLSMRMLCEDEDSGLLQDRRSEFEDLIHSEDVEAESQILQFFKDSGENLAAALLHLRWCAIAGFPISWSLDQSQWAKRLSTNYDTRRKS